MYAGDIARQHRIVKLGVERVRHALVCCLKQGIITGLKEDLWWQVGKWRLRHRRRKQRKANAWIDQAIGGDRYVATWQWITARKQRTLRPAYGLMLLLLLLLLLLLEVIVKRDSCRHCLERSWMLCRMWAVIDMLLAAGTATFRLRYRATMWQ